MKESIHRLAAALEEYNTREREKEAKAELENDPLWKQLQGEVKRVAIQMNQAYVRGIVLDGGKNGGMVVIRDGRGLGKVEEPRMYSKDNLLWAMGLIKIATPEGTVVQ